MTGADALDLGREAFRQRAWRDAYVQLSAADGVSPLDTGDLELLVTAAYLLGRDDDGARLSARAYRDWLARGEWARAARCAFWLGFQLLLWGEPARGNGWLARAGRLLDDGGRDCVEQGYLLLPGGLESIAEGDAAAGLATLSQVAKIGDRFCDQDLVALARVGMAQALIRLGESAEGVAMLDEVMVAVTADEMSTIVVGIVYCAAILEYREVFDLRRAREWTAVPDPIHGEQGQDVLLDEVARNRPFVARHRRHHNEVAQTEVAAGGFTEPAQQDRGGVHAKPSLAYSKLLHSGWLGQSHQTALANGCCFLPREGCGVVPSR